MPSVARHLRLSLVMLAGVGGWLAGAGCRLGDELIPFHIKVDSIIVTPPQLEDGAKLQAVFYAELGPDKCWLFERVEVERTNAAFQALFRGQHVLRSDCPQSPSRMAYVADIFPPHDDPFRITVLQPDGSKLERIITH